MDGSFVVEEIVNGDSDPLQEEFGDQLRGFHFHLDSEIFDRNREADGEDFWTDGQLFAAISAHFLQFLLAPTFIVGVAQTHTIAGVEGALLGWFALGTYIAVVFE